jgi:hypothetical protein
MLAGPEKRKKGGMFFKASKQAENRLGAYYCK